MQIWLFAMRSGTNHDKITRQIDNVIVFIFAYASEKHSIDNFKHKKSLVYKCQK